MMLSVTRCAGTTIERLNAGAAGMLSMPKADVERTKAEEASAARPRMDIGANMERLPV
jgi:hypothetical protein